MIWCGIVNGYLIGSYFFEENVNRVNFLELLRDILPELLKNVMDPIRWCTTLCIVRNYLNTHYNSMWIGRGGPVAWSPRLRDLRSLDFYLWGYLKNVVYSQRERI